MKKGKILTVLCFIISFGINVQLKGQVKKVLTYNIKYDNQNDSLNNWNKRKAELVDLLRYYEPEIFGLQEGLERQLLYLDENLGDYSRIGVGRDDGKRKGEFSPIYYDKNKFSVLVESTFWLSDSDDQISVGWDASMERICTYGLFEHKNNQQKVFVFNTHFDHIGALAREESAKLILSKIKSLNTNNYPVILMGDLNAEPESKPISILKNELADGADLSNKGIYGPKGTFTGFVQDVIPSKRIDYIFIKDLEVHNYRHIDDRMKNNHYISDHLPVLIEFKQ